MNSSHRLRHLLLTTVLVALSPLSQAADTPEALAAEYFEVIQAEGLSASTQFMHPDALAEFKGILMPVYDAEHIVGGSELLQVTFPGTSYDALKTMSPKSFMDGFMNLVLAQTGDAPIRFDNLDVIGTVAEGDARHVLTRMTVGAGELSLTQFEVLSFVPYEDSWRLQLNGDMKGLAVALRANLPSPPPPPASPEE